MKLLHPLFLFLSSCALAFGFIHFGSNLATAARYEAEGQTWSAYHEKEAQRQKTLQAYIELEAKRTNVQREMRAMIIAELKKCKRGKC
jgi:TfoX/Sxy family transcriptional regulator of competence genes